MTKKLRVAFLLLLVGLALPATGQDSTPNRRQLLDDVFSSEFFGATFKWYGLSPGASVFFDATCVFPPEEAPGPNDRCVVLLPAPAQTNFNERAIASTRLPGNTFKDVFCPVFLQIIDFQLRNTTGVAQPNAQLDYRASLTIESDVLKDPSAIDPVSGLPYNGKLDIAWGRRLLSRSMDVNERHREILQYTRACNAGVSKRQLVVANGLTEELVDRLFRAPMTVHLNIAGSARLVEFGTLFLSMRIMGN